MTEKINQDVNKRVNLIIVEMNDLLKERRELIHGIWVGRVAQEHVLMLGPGGTAKSVTSRAMADHIEGAVHFEKALDETTDPSEVFGPPDIKAMVDQGKTRRVIDNMLPEATDAFLDEFFNANTPLLHSLQPPLNERVFHNNGTPMSVPLRQCLMGTNKLNADADVAPLFDRVHLRYVVNYVQDRQNQKDMVGEAIARMALVGRGVTTHVPGQSKTVVTLDELDKAHEEALALEMEEPTLDLFFDIRDELNGQGVIVSDRRVVEGMAAILANAWIRNHEVVQPSDLDILAHMWWTVQEQIPKTRSVILEHTNPGEKAALDLLAELDKFKQEMKDAEASGMDDERKRRLGVEMVRNTDKLILDAEGHLANAKAAGVSTQRLDECLQKAEDFKVEVGSSVFKLDPNSMKRRS